MHMLNDYEKAIAVRELGIKVDYLEMSVAYSNARQEHYITIRFYRMSNNRPREVYKTAIAEDLLSLMFIEYMPLLDLSSAGYSNMPKKRLMSEANS